MKANNKTKFANTPIFSYIKWVRICHCFHLLACDMGCFFPFFFKKKNILAIFRKGDSKLSFGKPVGYLEMLTAKKLSTVIKCAFN